MVDAPTQSDALRQAVAICGGQVQTAILCNVTQPTVSYWVKTGKLPSEHVLTVEQATGVSKHLLRPDIYPPEAGVPPCSAPSVAGGVPVVPYDRDAVSDKGAA